MKNYLILCCLTVLLAACGGNDHPADQAENSKKEELKSDPAAKKRQISDLERAVESDQTGEDLKLRQKLLVAYADFVNFHNDDENSAEYLFRAGKLANEIGKPRRAIEYLVNLHDGFPRYERRTEAAFLIGFIYENVLNDREMAEKYYEKVVELYPETQWAEDARLSLQMLYLTDEEKIQKFIKQNNQVQ